jgi:hypothetical protein
MSSIGVQRCPRTETYLNPGWTIKNKEDLVWNRILEMLKDPGKVLDEYLSRMEDVRSSSSGDKFNMLMSSKRAHIDGLTSEKQRLIDLYQTGAIALEEIESRLQDVRRKTKQFEEELIMLQKQHHERCCGARLFYFRAAIPISVEK